MNLSKIESPNWMAPEGDYFFKIILLNFKNSVERLEVDYNINIHEIWFSVWGRWGGGGGVTCQTIGFWRPCWGGVPCPPSEF